MFVNFIYYRMLVDVAIFHGIIKKALRSLKARTVYSCFDVHSLSALFIYLLTFFLIYFHHLCLWCHNRSDRWKVVNITKTLKGI